MATADVATLAEAGHNPAREPQELLFGAALHLKPNVAHWRGGSPTTAVVQATGSGGSLEWMDPRTDDECAGRKKR